MSEPRALQAKVLTVSDGVIAQSQAQRAAIWDLRETIPLANRIVMAPMTRNRAIGNLPGELIAEYYAQRASAGLIITEGTAPSANGLGYARIPGLFDEAQALAGTPNPR